MILSNQRCRGTIYLPASWVSLHQDWIKRVIKALDGIIVKAELNEVSLEYTAISPHFSEQPDPFEHTSRHSPLYYAPVYYVLFGPNQIKFVFKHKIPKPNSSKNLLRILHMTTQPTESSNLDIIINISPKCADTIKMAWQNEIDVDGPDTHYERGHRIWQTHNCYAKLYFGTNHWYLRYVGPISRIDSIPHIELIAEANPQMDGLMLEALTTPLFHECLIKVTVPGSTVGYEQFFKANLIKIHLNYESNVDELL